MRVSVRPVIGVILALAVSVSSAAESTAVPPELSNWQDWVLRGEEFRECPFLATGSPADASAFRCTWPGALNVAVTAGGGRFAQDWQVYADSWVKLPGSVEFWPRAVQLNGRAAVLVQREGVPQLRLPPGRYSVTGEFVWSTRPEALPLDPRTALVQLRVDGSVVSQPERPDGNLWFGRRQAAAQPAGLELQVYRLLRDEIPAQLETRLRLQIAGDPREERFGNVLPAGFTPLALDGGLPARLDPDGGLRVQVRAGSFELTLTARGASVATKLARPPASGRWPKEEVWSFAGNDRLRVAGAEGAAGIDPAQANVPPEWRNLPAFRLAPDTALEVVERSRGLANVDDNRLSLSRNLWLDFDHRGFTAVDEISGSMRRDWRLDMQAPFRLESARRAGESLLVTEGQAAAQTGVEWRWPQVSLSGVARSLEPRSALPATGWASRFDSVEGTLHLPPGHRLIAAPGTDEAPTSWLETWGLWNAFGVLVVVVFIYWTAGRWLAAIAALAFVLTYQEEPGFIWLWGNLLAAMAIARAAPDGRFQRFAAAYRLASFVILGLALVPFAFQQVRLALHPQLESTALWPASMPVPMAAEEAPAPAILMDQVAVTAAGEAGAPSMEADMAAQKMRSAPPFVPSPDIDVNSAGLNMLQKVQRYAAGTLLQAGPGIPSWRFNSYPYRWSGPVEPGQTVRFVYIGPVLLFFWRVIGVVALIALFVRLLRASSGTALRWPVGTSAASGVLAVLVGMTGAPDVVRAASTPDPALLQELKTRLTAVPPCVPNCAELLSADVSVEGDTLTVTLNASALAPVAFAIPHAADRWQIGTVSVDDRSAVTVAREADASLWIPLSPGAHRIRVQGELAAAESLQLAFPQPPRAIAVRARGWTASGVNEGRLLAGTLELVRDKSAPGANASPAVESAAEFPPFVRVQRTFNLDLDWTIDTQVVRVAPARAAITIEVPLVENESVLTEGIEVRDGRVALVGLAPGQGQVGWRSGLARSDRLALNLARDVARSETWRFVVNPQWHVEFEGFPAVLPDQPDAGDWMFTFYPRAGETLKLTVARPKPAAGRTFAIDAVTHRTVFGKRSADAGLTFRYRSTQGTRHAIRVPEQVRVTAVLLDGQPVPLRPEKGELSIALLPGEHEVAVNWQSADGAGWRSRPVPVDLRAPASNIETIVELPESRWPLYALGSGVGPAVLYWNELLVFVIVAWLLGRLRLSPLRFHEWLLLGAGLSTLSWGVFATMVLWFFALRWRSQWSGGTVAWRFNAVQVLLAAFTVVAISSLLFSGIRYGLLAAPDMGVAGPGSGGNTFRWFGDQVESALPEPSVITAPIWLYRTLMFAWALWIAIALVRWLKWAFDAWTKGGIWRGSVLATPSTTP